VPYLTLFMPEMSDLARFFNRLTAQVWQFLVMRPYCVHGSHESFDLKKLLARFVLIAGFWMFGAATTAVMAANSARDPVDRLHATLLNVMKLADRIDTAERYSRIKPVLESTFDLRLMTALSTGPAWRNAGDADKGGLVSAFGNFSIATYASRFNAWSGQSFETLEVKDGPRGTKLVRTRINRPAEDAVPLTYVVRQRDGKWRIVDILLNAGISEIAIRRSEYRKLLKAGGTAGLKRELNERARKLLNP
jgi:phospholipid transport system substrate-binding protein